jgi:hypothetical protein
LPKFIVIGYGDREGYDRITKTVRDAAHAQDEVLQASGALMGIAGIPMQVRNHADGGVLTESGPYGASPLPVAGFTVIDAPTMAEAIKMVSRTPCAVAYGVVEVWPLEQSP